MLSGQDFLRLLWTQEHFYAQFLFLPISTELEADLLIYMPQSSDE